MEKMHALLSQFLEEKIVVIMRGLTPEKAIPCGESLVKAGIHLMEVPLNRPGALEAIHALAEHFRNTKTHVGAGTVLTPDQVDAVAAAGGEFIISPNMRPAVIRRTKELGLLSMPGFVTPTEAFDAIDAGADILKVFPCGTPENIAVLKSVIPLPVFAVGGVMPDNKNEYLKTADGLGVGIGIFKPEFSPEELYQSAKIFMSR